MIVNIYSKRQCGFCEKAKNLLNVKGIPYNETIIGEDILREDFMSLFPGVMTVPFIIIDEVKVGGYEQLVEYLSKQS